MRDIKGKTLRVPVHQLLGGNQRDLIPTFATTSARPGREIIEQTKTLIAAGGPRCFSHPRVMRTRSCLSRVSISLSAPNSARAKEEPGSDVVLGVDLHYRLLVAEAATVCQKMPSGKLDFLEESIRNQTPTAYAVLREMVEIPFAIGEKLASKWQFLPYIEAVLHQFYRLDVCNVGGLTEAMKVAGWSEAHYIDMMPHNPLGPVCTAATVHFCAAITNLSRLETRSSPVETHLGFDNSEFVPVQPRLENAYYPVSDARGSGWRSIRNSSSGRISSSGKRRICGEGPVR